MFAPIPYNRTGKKFILHKLNSCVPSLLWKIQIFPLTHTQKTCNFWKFCLTMLRARSSPTKNLKLIPLNMFSLSSLDTYNNWLVQFVSPNPFHFHMRDEKNTHTKIYVRTMYASVYLMLGGQDMWIFVCTQSVERMMTVSRACPFFFCNIIWNKLVCVFYFILLYFVYIREVDIWEMDENKEIFGPHFFLFFCINFGHRRTLSEMI